MPGISMSAAWPVMCWLLLLPMVAFKPGDLYPLLGLNGWLNLERTGSSMFAHRWRRFSNAAASGVLSSPSLVAVWDLIISPTVKCGVSFLLRLIGFMCVT